MYENFGVWDNGDRVDLASLFFPLTINEPLELNYERLAVTRLSITVPDHTRLAIKAWVEDELLFERQLTGEQFECRQQYLVLHASNWGLNSIFILPIVYRTSVEHLLSRAQDGALIIENHELSGGAVAVVPIGLKAQYWYRFESSPATRSPADIAKLPRGVRQHPLRVQVLRPPADAPDWSGYDQAKKCLTRASQTRDDPMFSDRSSLGGRSTQAFLLQTREDVLVPHGIVQGNNWHPATHDLRIEKQHREAPELADRYVLCLLRKGYRWDDE
jgi:hypothetical protein